MTDIPKDNRPDAQKRNAAHGGAAIFLAFTVTVLIFCKPTVQTIAMLIGNLIIVITGIIDDKYDMNAFVKLFLQIAASVVAVGGGIVFEQINLFGHRYRIRLACTGRDRALDYRHHQRRQPHRRP